MRWSSRLGDPQIGLLLVHHSGGLNSSARLFAPRLILEYTQFRRSCASDHGQRTSLGLTRPHATVCAKHLIYHTTSSSPRLLVCHHGPGGGIVSTRAQS